MNKINIQLAGVNLTINYNFSSTYNCLCKFYREGGEGKVIEITEDRLLYEKRYLECKFPLRKFSFAELEYNVVYREVVNYLSKFNIHVMHGVLLKIHNSGLLFTAPSGTGKSTHAMLWKEKFGREVSIINGDKPLLKLQPDGIMAYGSPWNGKERIGCSDQVPLRKICIVQRYSQNTLTSLDWNAETITYFLTKGIVHGIHHSIIDNLKWLKVISNYVSLYELKCNISEEAVNTAYTGMFKFDTNLNLIS